MIVNDRQTMLDVALATCGSAEAIYAIALANGKSVSDILAVGEELQDVAVLDGDIVGYLQANKIVPCTFTSEDDIEEFNAGDYANSIAKVEIVAQSDKYAVVDNQSLIDIAIIVSGSAEALFELAVKNGKSVSSIVEVGEELQKVAVRNSKIATYYSARNIVPATATQDASSLDGEFEITEFNNEEFYV